MLIHHLLFGIFVGFLSAVPLLLMLPGAPRRIGTALVVALAIAAIPSLAAAAEAGSMAPIVDGVVTTYPAVAPWLLAAQWVAGVLAPLVRRTHRTWLHSGLAWVASLPVRPALPPAAEPARLERY